MTYYDQVKEAADAVRPRLPEVPQIGVILGSGLGDFAASLGDAVTVPYGDLPHWPASHVIGHEGKLVVGKVAGRTIAALAGRSHLYEGHDPRTATFAVRVLGVLGIQTLVITNAAGRGTGEGLHLALNVGAMLISFLALVAMVNYILGYAHLSLQQIFGWVFAPVAWSMGVPWRDAPTIGNLLGTRMALNEFVAYAELGRLKLAGALDPKSVTIATFALCGFANFSSIGIQIGGIGALAPNRRHDLARLGLRAMFAGTLANFMTATIAGFLL